MTSGWSRLTSAITARGKVRQPNTVAPAAAVAVAQPPRLRGRNDSEIASSGEKRSGAGWPAFEERSFEAFRSYYDYLPKGKVKMEYTVRLNNVGDFALPPSRVEAMYAPEMFGEETGRAVII